MLAILLMAPSVCIVILELTRSMFGIEKPWTYREGQTISHLLHRPGSMILHVNRLRRRLVSNDTAL